MLSLRAGGCSVSLFFICSPFVLHAGMSNLKLCALSINPIEGTSTSSTKEDEEDIMRINGIEFVNYTDESQLDEIMRLVGTDLSEPYSIFTYRYFLHNWPQLCIIATFKGTPVGCVVCKIDEVRTGQELHGQANEQSHVDLPTEDSASRMIKLGGATTKDKHIDKVGYLGMLAVDKSFRGIGIGTSLSIQALDRMRCLGCSSVVLETEACNKGAMRLYERLGFIREELLEKYYLNWGDAFRLRLWFC